MSEGLIESAAWQDLLRHRDALKEKSLADLVLADPKRLKNSDLSLEGLHLNYALDCVTPETIALLAKLAKARGLEDWRERMWRGEAINSTENRAALHVALRYFGATLFRVDGRDVTVDIKTVRQRIAVFASEVRDGRYLGSTGKRIRHVVNIGIGGSDLGPRLVTRALQPYATILESHFVANADAFELVELFERIDPEETLFVIVSKTFTTQETLLNARTARKWFADKLGEQAVKRHFVAVSVNLDEVKKFGIADNRIFPMWDWVGGRFSLWSAVGLSIVLAIGGDNFDRLLKGAAAMDLHFKHAPLEENLPVILGMLGIWARNFMDIAVHVVLPYSERLRDLPRYLQQLEMESNGKSVNRAGKPVEVKTTPVQFGECGTIGQHSFHQWLHQGSDIVSVDFIGIRHDDLGHADHHQTLLCNMVAQAGAFAFGHTNALQLKDIYAGNRPSTLITLDCLDPYNLGMLLALYEHKVFVQSIIWDINPFDQPGVELGKRMAKSLASGTGAGDQTSQLMKDFYTKISS